MTPAVTSETFFKSKPGSAELSFSKRDSIFKKIVAVLDQPERRRFNYLMLLDVFISIVDILSLAFLLWIVQFYIQPEQTKPLFFLRHWMINRNSIGPIAIFFLLFSVKNLLAFLIARSQNNFVAGVAVRISRNNLIHYQEAPFEEFTNIDSSVHIRRIALQPFEFCQNVLGGLLQINTQVALIIIAVAAIIIFNAKLFLLLLLILMPPVVTVFYFIKRFLTSTKLQMRKSNQLSHQYLSEALKGYVEGNIYGRNSFFLDRFVSHQKKFSWSLFSSISIQTLPSRLIEIFAVMGLFILIVIAKWMGGGNTGTFVTIGAFMAAAYKIIPGLVKIVNTVSQMKAYESSLGDIIVEEEKRVGSKLKADGIQCVRFLNVSFKYAERHSIKKLSFSISSGDFIGIKGKSGQGKTTILNLLLGFLTPGSGQILINHLPLGKNEIKEFWPFISYVRQQPFFIHDTVLRNIVLEEETCDNERLESVIKLSGVNDLVLNTSDGLNKIITENGKNISGGQQQRVALARAMYKDADLILLDEPFNELDEASELFLLNHFRELANNGKMILMVTHNKKALSFCNKIISLDDQ